MNHQHKKNTSRDAGVMNILTYSEHSARTTNTPYCTALLYSPISTALSVLADHPVHVPSSCALRLPLVYIITQK